MRSRDIADLIALAALWGASFLFMRVAAPAFGPVALAALRVGGAALLLLPLLALQGDLPALGRHWRPIAIVGIVNSALPFLAFSFAALSLDTGVSAIFNSASPLFAASIAWLWLGERLGRSRLIGLAVGFAGVFWIVWSRGRVDSSGPLWAMGACVAATVCYGVSPSLVKRHLSSVPSLAIAAGSQLSATLFLAVPAALAWPAVAPPLQAWLTAAALALFCTGLAYILFFRLIANAGGTTAISVTFLVPLFAVAWGGIFLGETLSSPLIVGCGVVFAGTALATGAVGFGNRGPRRQRA